MKWYNGIPNSIGWKRGRGRRRGGEKRKGQIWSFKRRQESVTMLAPLSVPVTRCHFRK
jgi:hypothetical protein